MKPTARSWAAVFAFAMGRAGTDTPWRATTDR